MGVTDNWIFGGWMPAKIDGQRRPLAENPPRNKAAERRGARLSLICHCEPGWAGAAIQLDCFVAALLAAPGTNIAA
jgi:hypothetical protein